MLQLLASALAGIDPPTPEPQALEAISVDDPNHQFQSPDPSNVSGICPTLTALANHGYLSRNGINSFAEAAYAAQNGFGFNFGLSVFLSVLGLMAGDDVVSGR